MRGAGGCGGPAGGAGTRGAATGGCGAADAVIEGAAGAAGLTTAGGTCAAGRGGAATDAVVGAKLAADFSTPGTTTSGRSAGVGAKAVGVGTDGVTGGGVGLATGVGGATAGLAASGGAVGRTGAATASFFCVMAFSTSPGREMCDKSILVLISSSPRSGRADRADDCASEEPRMWARTFSASCSSSELEWVFFSVTPTIGRASRMALLLTSSSLARSLIRTLLIRPFLYSALLLGLHCILTESRFLHPRIIADICACLHY